MYFLAQLRVVFLDHVRTCTYVFLSTVTCRVSICGGHKVSGFVRQALGGWPRRKCV